MPGFVWELNGSSSSSCVNTIFRRISLSERDSSTFARRTPTLFPPYALFGSLPTSALLKSGTRRKLLETRCPTCYRSWAILSPLIQTIDTSVEEGEALIAHYRARVTEEAVSPNPFFDEAAARVFYPAINDAVVAGELPCAFAMELAFGIGQLETLKGLAPELRRDIVRCSSVTEQARALHRWVEAEQKLVALEASPEPLPARLPHPVTALKASESIYASWFSRLRMTPEQRSELEQDEQIMRHGIETMGLARMPLVSVIMPTWNRAFTIGEAIQSLLEQSYPNWELIVCDDASVDRTADVVRGFDDPRIRYMKFLKSNGAGARNKGLTWARGEYIAYLDSDNLWHPQFLDMMLRQLLANPGNPIAYAAYLDTEIVGGQVELADVHRPAFRPIQMNSRNFMDLNSIIHHRRLYDWMGGFDTNLPRLQDWDLALRYTSIFRPIFVNHASVLYRRNLAWGQVTHLFMNSDARDTVREKTRRRIEDHHERLQIPWPERGRITILCGNSVAQTEGAVNRVLAESLARMAADVADVNLVELGVTEAIGSVQGALHGVTRHAIPFDLAPDPQRLGRMLVSLCQDAPVVTVGLDDSYLRAIEGLDPALVWRLRGSGEGSVLQGLESSVRFDLGALPLDLPEPVQEAGEPVVLGLLDPGLDCGERTAAREAMGAEARTWQITLLMPGDDGAWLLCDESGWQTAEIDVATGLPTLLGNCIVTACLCPVTRLDPFGLALLNALQGRGIPAAVVPDRGKARATDFARQWIEAHAAYKIEVNEPRWVFEKLRKLIADSSSFTRMREQSRVVHAIAFHSELTQERLSHALYRFLYDEPHREVINVR